MVSVKSMRGKGMTFYTLGLPLLITSQYMSNIYQTQMKGKQNNKTNKRNKENRRKGLGVPLGQKVQRL